MPIALTADAMLRLAVPLPGDQALATVPEPTVKRLLEEYGITVPRSAIVADAEDLATAAAGLTPPLVIKAWAPGLIHKTDVGAVELGFSSAAEAGLAAQRMRAKLASAGFTPSGFLAEEQQAPGVEMIVGVVRRPPFGLFISVGFGGTLVEVLQDVSLRPVPIDRTDAEAMLSELRGKRLLDSARGRPAADRAALIDLMLRIGSADAFAPASGPNLAEFEVNPVIVSAGGAVAVDARLLLTRAPPAVPDALPRVDFEPLFTPRVIAVVGASAKSPNFGNMFLRNYKAYGFPGQLYAIHPEAPEIDGVKAFPSLATVPDPIDYALIAAPAPVTPAIVQNGAGRVRFAQVMSGGFREAGSDGAALEPDLLAAARESGIRLLGPNCMGVWSARGRQTFLGSAPERAGDTAIISQSGSIGGDILKVGDRLGVGFSALITIGNSIDVTAGELLEWLVEDPHSRTIGLYLEDPRDGERLIRALKAARAKGKPTVLLIAGTSRQGAVAAASHTGAMAGSLAVWQGIARQTGAILTRTLEDFLDALMVIQVRRAKAAIRGDDVLIFGAGGGCNVLATDACDEAGLSVAPVDRALAGRLSARFGAGACFDNPVEVPMGPFNAATIAPQLLKALNDPSAYANVMFHINVQSFYSYGKSAEHSTGALLELAHTLCALSAELPRSHLTWILRNAICADSDIINQMRLTAHAGGVASFLSFQAAAAAIAALSRAS